MLVDLVFKKRRFLTIFFLAIIIFAFDLYLFIDDKSDNAEPHWFFMLLLGATLSSSNLIYLILIPMLIAKQYSEEMAENQRFQRVCYAGTIAGAVLAMTSVCRYLVSDNVATLLHYWTRNPDLGKWVTDLITILLLLTAILILYGQISKEFRETSFYHKMCVRRSDEEDYYTDNSPTRRANSSRYNSNSLLVKRNKSQSSQSLSGLS